MPKADARSAICRLYDPLPHPYYHHLLCEQGFAKAAEAAAKHVPAGRMEQALEAMGDEVLDKVAIVGTLEQCRDQLARFSGVVDQALLVNVNYSGTSEEALLNAYQSLIELASRTASPT